MEENEEEEKKIERISAGPVSGDKSIKNKSVLPVGGAKISYNYLIVISAQKRGKGKVSTLKLESENYPIIDKVYSILSA
jgi:hypothetical protein